jgi:hypothetical protein
MTHRPLLPYCFEVDVWPYRAYDCLIYFTDTRRASECYGGPAWTIAPYWNFAAQVATANHHLIPGWIQ